MMSSVAEDGKKEDSKAVAGFDGQKVKNTVIHYAKLVGAALAIWTIGWFGLHYVWVLMGLIIYSIWNMNKREKEKRMKSLVEVTKNEQKALARRKDLPSWVDFPDMQRAEWLNEIIFQLWPFVGKMVRQILKETVEPKLQEKLPSVIKSLYFEKIDLGDQAPKLGGIKVYSKNIERSEMIMDCDFIYAGDAVVKLAVRGISAGITNVQMRGKIRFELNPLIAKPPLVGGIAVYFLDVPDINFDLTNLLNILDVPGLSDILHCVVKEAVSSFVVLPNRIKIPLSETADLEALKYPMPEGVLRIHVIGAEDLVAKDTNVFSKDTSDPYAIITVGSQTLRTSEKEETLNPVWNETFEIFVESILGRKIKVELFDHDVGSSDESLGKTEISMEKIAKHGSSELWMPLEGVKSGKIHLKCEWLKFSSKSADIVQSGDENSNATAALFVKLDSANSLPVTNQDDDTCSPFCTITVGNEIESSKKLADTSRPVWEEMFQFLIKDPKHQELNIQVYDWKHDRKIGRLDFPIDRLLKNREMRFKQPFHLTNANEGSVLSMIVELKALIPSSMQETKIIKTSHSDSIGELELIIKWDSGSNKLVINVQRARNGVRNFHQNLTDKSPDYLLAYLKDSYRSGCLLEPEIVVDLVAINGAKLETYVELQLLPDKSEAGFRETKAIKDKDPKYNQEFYYFIGYEEAKARSLKTTVFNLQDGKKNKKVPIGETTVKLETVDILTGAENWFRLQPSAQ